MVGATPAAVVVVLPVVGRRLKLRSHLTVQSIDDDVGNGWSKRSSCLAPTVRSTSHAPSQPASRQQRNSFIASNAISQGNGPRPPNRYDPRHTLATRSAGRPSPLPLPLLPLLLLQLAVGRSGARRRRRRHHQPRAIPYGYWCRAHLFQRTLPSLPYARAARTASFPSDGFCLGGRKQSR